MKKMLLITSFTLLISYNFHIWGQEVYYEQHQIWSTENRPFRLDTAIGLFYSIKDTISNGGNRKVLKIEYLNNKEFPLLMLKPLNKIVNSFFENKRFTDSKYGLPLKMWHYFYFDKNLEGMVRGSFFKDYFEEENTTKLVLLKPLGIVSFSFFITEKQAQLITENPNKLEAYVVVVPLIKKIGLFSNKYFWKDEKFWCESSEVFYAHSSKDVRKKERKWCKRVKKTHRFCGTGLFSLGTLEIQKKIKPLK